MNLESDHVLPRPESTATAAPRAEEEFQRGPIHDLFHPLRGQISALDALRALAVTLVIVGHGTSVYLASGGVPNTFSRLRVVTGAWIGVDLFFVLSGYFIGKQLWRELQKTGTIDFGRFMVRRGLRIWPLYFSFLAFVLLVLGRGGGPTAQGWSDAVFLTNYFPGRGVVIGSWTLCTEEQFYIVAPLLLLFGSARLATLRGYRKYLVGVLAALPIVRAFCWWRLTGDLARHDTPLYTATLYRQFHTHCDGLVMGLLLANLEAVDGEKYKRGFLASAWSVLATVPLFFLLQRASHEVFNYTTVALTFGATTWFLLSGRPRWLAWLDWRGFYVASRLSYGKYLNNEYMMHQVVGYVSGLPWAAGHPALANATVVAILFVLSAGVAAVTFCLIEYPFLRLRGRILARWGRPSPAPARPVPDRAAALPRGSSPPDEAEAADREHGRTADATGRGPRIEVEYTPVERDPGRVRATVSVRYTK